MSPLYSVPPPVFGDGVQLLESVQKMKGMLFSNVFNAEVIDHKGEVDRASFVGPQRRCQLLRMIPKFGKVLGESVVGNPSGLFEAGHAFSYLHIYPAIGCGDGMEFVLVDDLVWEF